MVNTFRAGLTRLAYSQQGDSTDNDIGFRFVYWPRNFDRTLNRTTPLWNFVDDLAWVSGNHTWQFGTNIRVIRNQRTSFANSWDAAVTNPSFYEDSGAVLDAPITDIGGSVSNFQAAICAAIGRYSQYSGNYNYGADGKLLPLGTGVARSFGTEEYEFYGQDTWRVHPDLTLTLGLRYSLNKPVYETNGIQVRPSVSLGGFLDKRAASAAKGIPYNEIISIDLAGPANNRPGYYDFEKKNFAPRAAFAWQPNFENGFLKAIFGAGKKSVFRGGFAMTYDRIGSALAVSFDLNSTLGFSSSQTIAANTYNVSDNPAPLYTGPSQNIRTLPNIVVPPNVDFPLTTPADEDQRIEQSLDDTLTTPKNYSWNFSIGREFRGGLSVEVSYVGRAARNLLATRDIMQLNNLVDSKSGMDWYTAANLLYDLRDKNTPVEQVKPIPYFENLFPDLPEEGPTERNPEHLIPWLPGIGPIFPTGHTCSCGSMTPGFTRTRISIRNMPRWPPGAPLPIRITMRRRCRSANASKIVSAWTSTIPSASPSTTLPDCKPRPRMLPGLSRTPCALMITRPSATST